MIKRLIRQKKKLNCIPNNNIYMKMKNTHQIIDFMIVCDDSGSGGPGGPGCGVGSSASRMMLQVEFIK